jgi:hypothetical protein
MSTTYLILFTLLGGGLALFIAAGWSSYKDNKLPETSILFRWFVAGSFTSGLAAYAYLFGAGGDPTSMFQSIGESLEIKEVVQTLTSAVAASSVVSAAVGGDSTEAKKSVVATTTTSDNKEEIKVGMPNF